MTPYKPTQLEGLWWKVETPILILLAIATAAFGLDAFAANPVFMACGAVCLYCFYKP
jgi:hypothetical protein